MLDDCKQFDFNPKKTLALLISPQLRNDCSSPQVTLTLNREMINTTETARYLRIIIDSKLKFQSHISLLEKKIGSFGWNSN